MADRDTECAAAAARDDLRSLAPGHSDQISAASTQSAPPTSTAAAAAAQATSPIAMTGDAATATVAPTCASSCAGSSSAATGAGIGDSAADCVPSATAVTAASVGSSGSAPPPPATGASPSAAVSSSSSSSSAPAALKKCACCQRLLLDGDYSGAQLKAKGKRQCKVCVAALQSISRSSQLSGATSEAEQRQQQLELLRTVAQSLSGPSGPRELEASRLASLVKCLRLPSKPTNGAAVRRATKMVSAVLHAAKEPQTDQIRALALECIALMACMPTVLAQMVAGGAISILLGLLQSHDRGPTLSVHENIWGADAVERIARASRANCDALLAAGALDVLLPLLRSNISADLRAYLFIALVGLMRGRPATDVAAAVSRLGAVLVDDAAPPELLCACLDAFGEVITSSAFEDPNLKLWVESILAAAPGMPQRLVDLMGDRESPEVTDAALGLLVNMFCTHTDQLGQLFDCGLVNQLPPLLSDTEITTARPLVALLCRNVAVTKHGAQLLVERDPIVERMLALLSTSEGETIHGVLGFLINVAIHRDRHMTRRLVDEHRALPPVVATLRRAIQMADQPMTHWGLDLVAEVLIVGDAEAADDPRGINPYIEPLDWLGVFELADPLQNSTNVQMAEKARLVFSYFIPNDFE